jgi:hypothetical protein
MALMPALAAAQPAAPEPPVALTWHRVTPAVVEGKGWTDTAGDFDRFPARAKDDVPDAVWELSQQSAGP